MLPPIILYIFWICWYFIRLCHCTRSPIPQSLNACIICLVKRRKKKQHTIYPIMQSLIYSCRVSKEIYSFLLLVHQSLNHHYFFSKCYTGLRGHQWRSFSFENKLYINTQFTEGSSVSLHQLMLFSSLWILFSYQPLLPPMLGDGGWGLSNWIRFLMS